MTRRRSERSNVWFLSEASLTMMLITVASSPPRSSQDFEEVSNVMPKSTFVEMWLIVGTVGLIAFLHAFFKNRKEEQMNKARNNRAEQCPICNSQTLQTFCFTGSASSLTKLRRYVVKRCRECAYRSNGKPHINNDA